MKSKNLFFCFIILLCSQLAHAQQRQSTDPALLQRLKTYVADNHLYPGGIYMYFDTVTKKPLRFSPKDYMVENVSKPEINVITSTSNKSYSVNNLTNGTSNFHLVKDINTLTNADPINFLGYNAKQSFAVLNNVTYFAAHDGIHGVELWRSDGTATGTFMAVDIRSGVNGSNPAEIIATDSSLYFLAYSPTNGAYGLWKSDGTATGTILLSDFVGYAVYPPAYLCNVNGIVYFTALSTTNRYSAQLWKTDGTTTGTVMVKDLGLEEGSNIRNLVSANNLLFFVASTKETGGEIWRSDGTGEGTYMLKDIDIDTYLYNGPSNLTAYNNLLYFSEAEDNNYFYKLWQTDGTPEGTILAQAYNTKIQIKNYSAFDVNIPFTISNNKLYFFGSTPSTGTELYTYNPLSGTKLVKDITPGTASTFGFTNNMIDVNGIVYFSFVDNLGYHLYKTNGTSASTFVVKDFSDASDLTQMVNGNGKLYFVEKDPVNGYEPWISDGTNAGTTVLKDIYPGAVSSYPASLTATDNDNVFFSATDYIHGNELWITDGNNTQLITEINTTTTASSDPMPIIPVNDGVIMNATTIDKNAEPWISDGNDAKLVKDISPGESSSYAHHYLVKDGEVYFMANPDIENFLSSYNVYKTNGSDTGITQVTSIMSDPLMNLFDFTITDDGTIFYAVYSYRTHSNEIWKTDGTPEGTKLVKSEIGIAYFSIDVKEFGFPNKILIAAGNMVYFKAFSQNNTEGTELWRSDGTQDGTYIVKDINPVVGQSSQISFITAFNNQVYFDAFDGTKTAVWKSNGTTAGTIKLSDAVPFEFRSSNNILFFSGQTDSTGMELWKTDGTVSGTIQISDIYDGPISSSPAYLTDVNGTLFFHASDVEHGDELWKSNGTALGTQLVKDIVPGTSSTFFYYGIYNFTVAASKLFFTMTPDIWASDGTSGGTGMIIDEGLNGVVPQNLIGSGNQIFFLGSSYKYGYELYAGDVSQIILPVSLLSFTALVQGADVNVKWQTSTEINTDYFNVQRSTDAVHFTNIFQVTGKSNSSVLQNYNFLDLNIANLIAAKTIYYRLETKDKDGKISLSKVVPVNLNLKDAGMILHPNPAHDIINIKLNNYSGNVVVAVYDLAGKKVQMLQQSVQSGNDLALNISTMPAGIYIVKVNLNGKILQQKFVKK